MEKIIFENLPSTNTPINAENLNQIQTNVEDVFNGNKTAGNMIVDSIRSKNVANDTTLKKGLWTSGNNIGSNATGWYVVVSIEGGKTYTISRKYIGSLYATTTTTFPASGVAQVDSWRGKEGIKQLTITTSNSAKYLFLGLLGGTSPTDTQKSQAIEELMVEEGDIASTYSPYQNLDNNEYVLWDGDTTSASITMNDDITNYKYIDVFFKSDGIWDCTRVYVANRTAFSLNGSAGSATSIWLKYSKYQIATNKLNLLQSWKQDINITNNTISSAYKADSSYISVTRVVGYK